ncbi:MAG TPA: PAS-domain containing protein, partial [Devosia sp.]|nr:PAS-domain containing protein [Devosia sp.]
MIRKSMQSPETSGAGATGFGADKDKAVRLPARERSAPHLFRGTFSINPVTAAVAVTAFVAASLFVIYDSVRTLDDASDDLALISEAFAEELADVSPDAVQLLLDSIGTSDMTFAEANFLNDVSEDSSDLRQAFEAVDLSAIDLANSSEATVTGIAQRGAMAFGLAVLLVLIAWRGRSWEMPDFAQRYSYETLAESIPMGIACWTKSGRLVVCNAQYRERLSLTSKSMTYHEAVSSLIAGGYMKLLNDDDSNRLLELHRNDGSCLMIDERPMRDGGFMTLVTDVTERKQADLLLSSIREEQRTLARRYHEEKL